jgi:hypothetical protein
VQLAFYLGAANLLYLSAANPFYLLLASSPSVTISKEGEIARLGEIKSQDRSKTFFI